MPNAMPTWEQSLGRPALALFGLLLALLLILRTTGGAAAI